MSQKNLDNAVTCGNVATAEAVGVVVGVVANMRRQSVVDCPYRNTAEPKKEQP